MKKIFFSLILIIVSHFLLKIYFQPIAIVLPHHNLVQSTREAFIIQIAQKRQLTRHIILISPDHFSGNQSQITSSSRNWNLSTGTAVYNNFLNLNLPQNDILLQNDHGIYNPLSDLKKYFPKADFFPILIGQKTTPSDLSDILAHINQYCKFDCLLVASVDFSHYLPATLAEVHDAYTINNLQNLNIDNIIKSEVDSPQSLYLLSSFARSKKAQKWTLFAHTNSGFIANNPDIETTTHVFGYYSIGKFSKSSTQTSTSTPAILDRFYGTNNLSTDKSSSFSVSTIVTPSTITKSYLPIKNNLFIRGVEKQSLIKNFFDSIPNNPTLTKDYYWGKLIYVRNNTDNP